MYISILGVHKETCGSYIKDDNDGIVFGFFSIENAIVIDL